MKLPILAATAILILAALPAQAQRRSERITCYREWNVISCPGYGEFTIRNDRNNNYRRDDDNYRPYDNSRYNDINGLQAINQIYFEVLGRRTDLSGARTYINNLNNGWTLQRVRADVAYSAEAEQVINRAYQEILRRDVDPSGLETYKRLLANGGTIADVRRELARSPEARLRY
ncbi:hypothetical protein Syn7502_00450 [Synechococcus sp. PCC 7502]|uniref:DUF4214 domain-containing protein n=1 Tax=Synechococcus sp. PCC 7502 TaxID=1173263 RepID=UPI00029FC3D6|nr:DUF4214 domain-containing protein [Synechococcus sp. PCC 7502]AFY72610.1 hypothetical protein Syn7502_00450 [Synechococcus sp. PCC 7502]